MWLLLCLCLWKREDQRMLKLLPLCTHSVLIVTAIIVRHTEAHSLAMQGSSHREDDSTAQGEPQTPEHINLSPWRSFSLLLLPSQRIACKSLQNVECVPMRSSQMTANVISPTGLYLVVCLQHGPVEQMSVQTVTSCHTKEQLNRSTDWRLYYLQR